MTLPRVAVRVTPDPMDDPNWDPLGDDASPRISTPQSLGRARELIAQNSSSAAQSAKAKLPRPGAAKDHVFHLSPAKMKLVEGLNDSKIRKESASAELAETDLELRKLELEKTRGSLITAIDARALIEEVHLDWVSRLDQLAELFAVKLGDSEVGHNIRESCKDLLDLCIVEVREAVANGPATGEA